MPSLNWIGKEAAERACQNTPIRALETRDTNAISITDDNLLIQGDNLFALRSLLPFYREQVKLAYLDPPYNTGNQLWIYNDAMNAPETRKWLGKTVGPEDLNRSDKWLCMMRPRLEAVYELLAEDGVLVCSIDDAELQNLLALLDAQFGKESKVAVIPWKTKSASNNASHISGVHEYVVIYTKNYEALRESSPQWRVEKAYVREVLGKAKELIDNKSLTEDERRKEMKDFHKQNINQIASAMIVENPALIEEEALAKAKRQYGGVVEYDRFDRRGLFMRDNLAAPGSKGKSYDILNPKTKKKCKPPKGGWRIKEEVMKKLIEENRILFNDDPDISPRIKRYLHEIESTVQISWIDDMPGRMSANELGAIFGKEVFPYAKPLALLERIISLTTSPGDLILDPFAGSGTTAHAVLKLNAENPSEVPRRFIAVEMEKEVEETVTSVRLDRVIEGYKTPKGKEVPGLGGSYSRLVVGEEVRNPDGSLGNASYPALAQILAAHHGLPLKETKSGKFPDFLIAEDDSRALFFYHGKGSGSFSSEDLEEVEKIAAGRQAIVYTHNSFVDAERAALLGIDIKDIPYDFPVAPITSA